MRMPKIQAIVTACYILLLAATLWAGDVALEWDHSVSPEVNGYRLYYGSYSRNYSAHVDVPYQTTWTLTGLKSGTWYITATATDAAGNESEFSNEVSAIIASTVSCDINGDASVNILDLQLMSNMVIVGHYDALYDLNQDEAINILDMQLLANIILGQANCPQ